MTIPYRNIFRIADLNVELHSDQNLMLRKDFAPFVVALDTAPDYICTIRQVDSLPKIPQHIVHEDFCYRVHRDEKGNYIRSFIDPPEDMEPYAVTRSDYNKGIIQVDYLAKNALFLSDVHNSFLHLGFEAMLIHRERLCLHAACVDTHLGGILFSGPSGAGKSTQANLWCKYRDAKQINGDRPILSKFENVWLAWGSPYAGSSKCHVNASCKVSAIVMVKQATKCNLQRLNLREAFRSVWSGLTVHSWDAEFVNQATDLSLDLIGSIPVYEFECSADENAVDYLERGLTEWKQ